MIVALCLYKYFPYGGLQRDFMRIAKTIAARGHHVRVYTRAWQGERPAEFECVDVPVTAHSNHGRDKQYQTWVQQHLTQYRQTVSWVLINAGAGLLLRSGCVLCGEGSERKGVLVSLNGAIPSLRSL